MKGGRKIAIGTVVWIVRKNGVKFPKIETDAAIHLPGDGNDGKIKCLYDGG
jgi:hypothetical protein